MSELTGKVQTVLGPIEPEELGVTLPHEHLISDGRCWFLEPKEATDKGMAHEPVKLDNLWWVRYRVWENLDDLLSLDEQEAIDEVMRFKVAGGRSVVELSSIGFGRDAEGLARICRATGLNVIMGSGYYLEIPLGDRLQEKSEDEITDEIVRDVTEGVDGTGIRAGIIGEVGCSFDITANEHKSLRAAARAQKITGAPLNVHCSRGEVGALQILDALESVGTDVSRTVIDHMDSGVWDREKAFEVARHGCFIEYDVFGREGYYPIRNGRVVDRPNDAKRINQIMELAEAGYLDQILIAQDIWQKVQKVRYGGWGYAHILRNVVPVMRAKGMSQPEIDTMLVENPKRLLTFA